MLIKQRRRNCLYDTKMWSCLSYVPSAEPLWGWEIILGVPEDRVAPAEASESVSSYTVKNSQQTFRLVHNTGTEMLHSQATLLLQHVQRGQETLLIPANTTGLVFHRTHGWHDNTMHYFPIQTLPWNPTFCPNRPCGGYKWYKINIHFMWMSGDLYFKDAHFLM